MPVAISFTVETDGRLPSGESLGDAIAAHRRRHRCASGVLHDQLRASVALPRACSTKAVRGASAFAGLRANASKRSHAELDAATELDIGDPDELGRDYRALRPVLPKLNVVGGCCGTDHRHVEAICRATRAAARAAVEGLLDFELPGGPRANQPGNTATCRAF